jgi:hypothetical protein
MSGDGENIDPLTIEIFSSIIFDLQGTSNHFLQTDLVLTKHLEKIKCLCSICGTIRNEVINLSRLLHNEIVAERMENALFIASNMKSNATKVAHKANESLLCPWNK